MARTDTLGHFLTDVADAIREKTGSSEEIVASDFDTEIESIETGGGSTTPIEKKDVNFYDYDGTVLYSYSASDFTNLTQMPDNPSHTNLTAEGWNWSLQDAQSYVESYGMLEIGQQYDTSDGSTRIKIEVIDNSTSVYLGIGVNGTATINWGDESSDDTITGSSVGTILYTEHEYSLKGQYTITISTNSNSQIGIIGNTTTGSLLLTNVLNANTYHYPSLAMIREINLGTNIGGLQNNSFKYLRNLHSISIPSTLNINYSGFFEQCQKLKHLTIPTGTTGLSQTFCSYCRGLETLSFSNTITSMSGNNIFQETSIDRVTLPLVSSLPNYIFRYSRMNMVVIPETVEGISQYAFYGSSVPNILFKGGTSLGGYCFYEAYSLSRLKFYKNITSIGQFCFSSLNGAVYFDFTNNTTIPSLGASPMGNVPSTLKIIVPDDLYEDWIANSSWSNYTSYIIKESDWNN